jgi:hypothetical protein
MGTITRLCKELKIDVDTAREGSRIHLQFRNHKTSFHVHDKIDGIIDSGVIISLREYIIDIGFRMKD